MRRNHQKSGGTGLQPVLSFQITQRCLPHWQKPGSIYFVTWRCRKGRTLDPEDQGVVLQTLRYFEGLRWNILAMVVMPDHVHVLARPLPSPEGGVLSLGQILHSIKRYTARIINQRKGIRGSLWQDERYDRIVRDDKEFLEKWNYLRNNPVKAGLSPTPEEYPWLDERGI